MASRLLERLDGEIAREEEPYRRECLKAQRTAAIARMGLLGEAKFSLAGLRTQARRFRQASLQAWVHIVEGMIEYYETFSPTAFEKFRVAQEQAVAAGDPQLQAYAAAWMAFCAFSAERDEDAVASLRRALRLAQPTDHATLARATLVRADLSLLSGLHDDAARHYVAAHRHAVADGDTSMISAALHNRIAYQSENWVMMDVLGQPLADQAKKTLFEVESNINLDRRLGNALSANFPIIQAELCTVLQRWGEAVTLYNTHFDQPQTHHATQTAARYLANRAWCLWHLQKQDKALSDADAAEKGLRLLVHTGDRVISHFRLAALFDLSAQPERAHGHAELAAQALAEHRHDKGRLADLLLQLDAPDPA
jgi:tetratricopeptide (TPR) repeat protein